MHRQLATKDCTPSISCILFTNMAFLTYALGQPSCVTDEKMEAQITQQAVNIGCEFGNFI